MTLAAEINGNKSNMLGYSMRNGYILIS